MENEKLQGENQFRSKTCLLEMHHLESAPQKLNVVMAQAISISYTLDRGCKFPCTSSHIHSLVFDKKKFI